MSRAEFIKALDFLIQRGDITYDERDMLISLFNAGQLAPDALWLPVGTSVEITEEDRNQAMLLAGLLIAQSAGSEPSDLIDQLSDLGDNQIRKLDSGSIRLWHDEMAGIVIRTTLAAVAVAGLDEYNETVQIETETAVEEQLRWLYLFAAAAAARSALGHPWTPAYMTARAIRYMGQARAAFFQAMERRQEYTDDYVVDYIAVDDLDTCEPCMAAEAGSPYLPGLGPWPGEVCEGGGYCRCRRVLRYDPTTAAKLANGSFY